MDDDLEVAAQLDAAIGRLPRNRDPVIAAAARRIVNISSLISIHRSHLVFVIEAMAGVGCVKAGRTTLELRHRQVGQRRASRGAQSGAELPQPPATQPEIFDVSCERLQEGDSCGWSCATELRARVMEEPEEDLIIGVSSRYPVHQSRWSTAKCICHRRRHALGRRH